MSKYISVVTRKERKMREYSVFDSLVQTLNVSVYGIVTFSARQPFSISTTMALPVQYLPYIQQTELKRSPHTHSCTLAHRLTQLECPEFLLVAVCEE